MRPFLLSPYCLKCGKEVSSEEEELCADCRSYSRSYIKGFPLMGYVEPVSNAVGAFKYNNKRNYSSYFAKELVTKYGKDFCDLGIQALVPVPIHKKKLRQRGYNQAELLAKKLGRLLGVPVETGIIERTINTIPQKDLSNIEREQNTKNAFKGTDKIVKYNKVLIVDDIYTTGATVEACTRVLLSKGVEDIYYTSICIGKGY
ncbi:MAG: ComF family protein [Lachnospiraceae bacterium]|nr:ComF family protein [Lachnospiraceae bacterium]